MRRGQTGTRASLDLLEVVRRLNAAFFTMNGIISVVFFGFVLAEAAS